MDPVVQDIYRRLFAIKVGTQSQRFIRDDTKGTISGQINVPCRKMFVGRSIFIIAVRLISVNAVVAVLYFIKRTRTPLPNLPTTIGNALILFEGCDILMDIERRKTWSDTWRYAYRDFISDKGEHRIGIERKPFVTTPRHGLNKHPQAVSAKSITFFCTACGTI